MKKKLLATTLAVGLAVASLGGCDEEKTPYAPFSDVKTLVAIGDSITCGVCFEDGEWGNVDVTFSDILKERIGCERLLNYGASGISISSVGQADPNYSLCRTVDEYETGELVLVAAGTNDYGNYEGVALGSAEDTEDVSFYGGVHVLFEKLKEKYADARVYVITPIRRSEEGKNAQGRTLDEYRAAIESKAKAFGFYVIDGKKMPLSGSDIGHREKYIPDGLHPNAEGHKIYAQYVWDEMLKREQEL